MAELDDTVEEVLETFDGTETYDEAEYALRDYSSKEVAVNAAKLAVAGGGAPGGPGGWPISDTFFSSPEPTGSQDWDTLSFQANHVVRVADNTDGAYLEWNTRLAAGVYSVDLYFYGHNGSAIVTASLDDGGGHVDIDQAPFNASGASVDTYTSGELPNHTERVADDLTIPEDGDYVIRIRNDGKNASSSGFQTNFNYLFIRRVSA